MSLPAQIGRYHILGALAAGGMGEILLAKLVGPGGFERPVVIKRALPHLAGEADFRAMFLDEARLMARLRHPNLVRITDLGEEGDDLFMVMEYLEGETLAGLRRRLARDGEVLPPALALHVMEQVLLGLHAAHEVTDDEGRALGVVHRDVSPQNVFVGYDGCVRVLDFGIAKFADRATKTETGHIKGKFSYMSPEQCRGEAVDRRSDLFSVGILLWELLTGARLFRRSSDMLTWRAIVEDAAPRLSVSRPDIPPALDELLARALHKDAARRFADAEQMREALATLRRAIDPADQARSDLVTLLRHRFADRIADKSELVRRVQRGSEVGRIPAAESERTPSRGELGVDVDISVEQSVASGGSESLAARPAPRSKRAALLGGALALGAAALLGVAIGSSMRPAVEAPMPAAAAAAPTTASTTARLAEAAGVAEDPEPPPPADPASALASSTRERAPLAQSATEEQQGEVEPEAPEAPLVEEQRAPAPRAAVRVPSARGVASTIRARPGAAQHERERRAASSSPFYRFE